MQGEHHKGCSDKSAGIADSPIRHPDKSSRAQQRAKPFPGAKAQGKPGNAPGHRVGEESRNKDTVKTNDRTRASNQWMQKYSRKSNKHNSASSIQPRLTQISLQPLS